MLDPNNSSMGFITLKAAVLDTEYYKLAFLCQAEII